MLAALTMIHCTLIAIHCTHCDSPRCTRINKRVQHSDCLLLRTTPLGTHSWLRSRRLLNFFDICPSEYPRVLSRYPRAFSAPINEQINVKQRFSTDCFLYGKLEMTRWRFLCLVTPHVLVRMYVSIGKCR